MAPCQDEGLLDGILCAIRVAEDEPGDAMQSGKRRSHQDGERVVIPALARSTSWCCMSPPVRRGSRTTLNLYGVRRRLERFQSGVRTRARQYPTRMLLALVDGDHQTPRHIAHITTSVRVMS